MMKMNSGAIKLVATALCVVSLGGVLSACAPLVLGGAAMGALVATDRRTSGAQLEDEGIELRAIGRINENLGDRVHVSVTSYNRQVLLSGEVPIGTGQAAGRADRFARRQRAPGGQRTGRAGLVLADTAFLRRADHRQGEGGDGRQQGFVRQRVQGRDRAWHRLPDGPCHTARGRSCHRPSRAAQAACKRWFDCSRSSPKRNCSAPCRPSRRPSPDQHVRGLGWHCAGHALTVRAA